MGNDKDNKIYQKESICNLIDESINQLYLTRSIKKNLKDNFIFSI